MPNKDVRGRGHAAVSAGEGKRVLHSLLERYLGGVDDSVGDRLLDSDRDEVYVRIDPERLHAWDYSERMESPSD